MTNRTLGTRAAVLLAITVWARGTTTCAAPLPPPDDLAQKATWSIPSHEDVRAILEAWLQSVKLDEQTRAKAAATWTAGGDPVPPSRLLDQVAETLALADPAATEIVDFCRSAAAVLSPPEFVILKDDGRPSWVRSNLRLLYGRWLAQHRFYDEAIDVLSDLRTEDVVDPAALLFYQGACYYRLLDKNRCLPVLARLLENEPAIPRRFATLSQLMRADLEPLETDSLDEIARMMDEVTRRLALHRAGTVVRNQEDEVVAKLDKIIKELEAQQQSASSAGNLQPSNPAQDSMPAGGTGP
ncbi:MAG: hypothetical protein FJ276_19645, partial [Planctomycetes bacterium]|nr:hypothetical protein [Planctomycetota bacterium]